MSNNALQALVILQQRKLDETQKELQNLRKELELSKPHFLLDPAGYLCMSNNNEYDSNNRLFQVWSWLACRLTTSSSENYWGNVLMDIHDLRNTLQFRFIDYRGIVICYYGTLARPTFTLDVTDQGTIEKMIDQLESIFKTVLESGKERAGQEKALENYQVVVGFCAQCREILWKK